MGAIALAAGIGPAWTDLMIATTRVTPVLSGLLVLAVTFAWVPVGVVALAGQRSGYVRWLLVSVAVVVAIVGPVVVTVGLDRADPAFAELPGSGVVRVLANLAIPVSWLLPPVAMVAIAGWRQRRQVAAAPVLPAAVRRLLGFWAIGGVLLLLRIAMIGSDAETAVTLARDAMVVDLVDGRSWRGAVLGAVVGVSGLATLALAVTLARRPRVFWSSLPVALLVSWFAGLFGPPGIGKGSFIDPEFEARAPGFQGVVNPAFVVGLLGVPLLVGLGTWLVTRRRSQVRNG